MTPFTLAAGSVLIGAGLILHFLAMRRIKRLCVEPHMIYPPDRYLTDGVYQLRHPAYIGALLEVAGAGILFLGWGGIVLAFAAWPFYADRIMREEKLRHAAKWLQQHNHRQAA